MDTSKFLGKFKDATLDHLQRMDAILLALEENPNRPEEVKELMREIHTLKGESHMMGFGDMADLSHAIEDVLRAQEKAGFAKIGDVTDELFAAFDEIRALLDAKLGQGGAPIDAAARGESLRALVAAPAPAGPAPAQPLGTPRPTAAPGTGASRATSDTESFGAIDLGDVDLPAELPDADSDWQPPSGHEDSDAAMREAFGIPSGEIQELVADHEGKLRPAVSMGSGADRLLARFVETGAARVARAAESAASLDGPGQEQAAHVIAAEIEALRREARMMGFEAIALLAQAVETLVAEAREAGALAAQAALLREALSDLGERVPAGAAAADASPDLFARLRDAAADPSRAPARAGSTRPAPAVQRPVAIASERPTARMDPLLAETFLASIPGPVESAVELAQRGGPDADRELLRGLEALRTDARVAGFTQVEQLAARVASGIDLSSRDGASRRDLVALLMSLEAVARAQAAGADAAPLAGEALAHVPRSGAPPTIPGSPQESVAASVPAETAREPGSRTAEQAPRVDETVRISLSRLEALGNLSGDIYLNHTRGDDRQRRLRALFDVSKRQARALGRLREALTAGGRAGVAEGGAVHDAFEEAANLQRHVARVVQDFIRGDRDEHLRVGHTIIEMRERVREMQMLPVSTLFDMYPRMVRDIAKGLGKKVRFVVEGGDVELDRHVLDEIRDPLVHLLRNAVDHGIERPDVREAASKVATGSVRLSARAEGDHVIVELEDDGAGIDPERLRRVAAARGVVSPQEAAAMTDEQAMNLIFTAGFSSKDEVSDLSGRGVGLDVVRDKVERLEGRITLSSEPGRGTRMALRLPLTLAVARVLLLRSGGLLVAVPSVLVEEVLQVPESAVRRVESYEALVWHEQTVPIVSLAAVLEREAQPTSEGRLVVILSFEDQRVGFVVDELEGEREVVVKRLDDFLGRIPNVAGATLLSSGDIVVVLHVPQLIASTMGVSSVRLRARLRAREDVPAKKHVPRLLVVDDSIIVRDMMKGVLEAAGFEVVVAVDGVDGLEKQRSEGFDLVITDIEMPRMDGFELTRALKSDDRHSAVPIIIVTTLDSADARERGLTAGAAAYIVKNLLDMSQLVQTIERLVA